jgi:thiol-disulfide isomerase/thioredoxin
MPRPCFSSCSSPARRRWLAVVAGAAWALPAPAADGQHQAWPRRRPTPALQLPRHDGGVFSMAAYKGQPLLLNFWASWCEPCRSEMPSLELLATRHEAQGLQVLALNFRETDAAVQRFIDASAFSLPVLRDREGAAAQAFGVRTFPSTVGIDRQGRARFTVVGECDWLGAVARRWLDAVL